MYLNQTAEYGLRAMAQLAIIQTDGLTSAGHLAMETGIPRHYISKILRRLVEADLVFAQKGHGGGFRLSRPPKKIRFADILIALDFEPHGEHCIFGWPQCGLENPCPLHDSWSVMNESFCEWADQKTLADIKPGESGLPIPKLRGASRSAAPKKRVPKKATSKKAGGRKKARRRA